MPLRRARVERYAPAVFAVVGLAMIVLAAVDYLGETVATTFAIIGAGLLVIGGLAGRPDSRAHRDGTRSHARCASGAMA